VCGQVNEAGIAKIHRQIVVAIHQSPQFGNSIGRRAFDAQVSDRLRFGYPGEEMPLLRCLQERASFGEHRPGRDRYALETGKERLAAIMVRVFRIEQADEVAGVREYPGFTHLRPLCAAQIWPLVHDRLGRTVRRA